MLLLVIGIASVDPIRSIRNSQKYLNSVQGFLLSLLASIAPPMVAFDRLSVLLLKDFANGE